MRHESREGRQGSTLRQLPVQNGTGPWRRMSVTSALRFARCVPRQPKRLDLTPSNGSIVSSFGIIWQDTPVGEPAFKGLVVIVCFGSRLWRFDREPLDLCANVSALPGNQPISIAPLGEKYFSFTLNFQGKSQALAGSFHPTSGEYAGDLYRHPAITGQTSRS